ncbi:hypothetical protein BHE74_00054615, partial [Ensete ventricosum]
MSPRSFSPANVSLRVEKESLASDSSPVGDESCGHLEGDGPRRGTGEEWYRPIVGGPHTGRLADRYVLLGTGPYRSVRPCDYNQGLPYQVVRPCTGWYVPVRELISTLTASYQVVPPKSAVDDQFWPFAVDFNCRLLIEGEIRKRRREKYLMRCSSSVPSHGPSPTRFVAHAWRRIEA